MCEYEEVDGYILTFGVIVNNNMYKSTLDNFLMAEISFIIL